MSPSEEKTELLAQITKAINNASPEKLHCCLFCLVENVDNTDKKEVTIGAYGSKENIVQIIAEVAERTLGGKVKVLADVDIPDFASTTKH